MKNLITLAVLLVVIGGGLYCYCSFLCVRYQHQVDYLDELKADEGFQQQYAVSQTVSGRIGSARRELTYLDLLDRFVETASTANGNLLELLKSCLPEGTSLSAIKVDDTDVALTGTAPDIQTLTNMERRIRASGAFSGVLISTIENPEEVAAGVNFYCEMILNGGAIVDEGKES